MLECDPPKGIGAPASAPGDFAPAHWGDGLSAMQSTDHPSEIDTEGVGYVVGRDLDDATLTSVARSVRWDVDDDVTGSPPKVEVPSGFRLVGTGSLAAHGYSFTPNEKLLGPRDGDWLAISQEVDNDAALAVARFWTSATAGQRCGGYNPIAESTVIRDYIVIRAIGPDNPRVRAALRNVTRNLTQAPAS